LINFNTNDLIIADFFHFAMVHAAPCRRYVDISLPYGSKSFPAKLLTQFR